MAINVMIADDHSMIREGLKQLLELEGNFKVIAEACDGVECLNKLETVTPDVLLLDINMPNMNGLEVLQKMKEKRMKIKVLVLTIHSEVEYLLKAVDIGVNGWQIHTEYPPADVLPCGQRRSRSGRGRGMLRRPACRWRAPSAPRRCR